MRPAMSECGGTLRIVPLSDVNLHTLVDLFNDAYSQYYVEIKVTPESLDALIRREDVIPESSCVALLGTMPAGVVFLGVRGERGYICGMGVRQALQGKGIGELLMREALRNAADLGLANVTLEVIDANFRAIRLYRKLGFVRLRDVGVFACEFSCDAGRVEGVSIAGARALEVLPLADKFNEMLPAWQNQPQSIAKMSRRLEALVAQSRGATVGYAVFGAAGDDMLLLDVAVSPREGADRRKSIAAALVHSAWMHNNPSKGRAFNLPLGGYQEQALIECGYEMTLKLQEMVVCLR